MWSGEISVLSCITSSYEACLDYSYMRFKHLHADLNFTLEAHATCMLFDFVVHVLYTIGLYKTFAC